MKIELHRIKIRDLVDGYVDDAESGVRGCGGLLDIRPAYQREFGYKEKERNAVISTVMKGFPLNVMYWVKNPDGTFEMVYFCEGTPTEKIDWFKVINIAGLKLTAQEMRNAVYSGPWVADAKRYFSKPGCVAQKIGSPYLNGSADRQEYLETAISWMVNSQKDKAIEEYMAIHQGNGEATELWLHFQKVVNWIETLFPKYRREMKGLEWGRLYREFSAKSYNPKALERRIVELMTDKEVQNNKGIYEFLLSGETRREKLNLRQFDEDEKRAAYEAQKGVCPVCGGHFEYEEMEGDHIVPWSKGGKTVPENLQMLCRRDNALKSDR